jgi:hypothetical protein
MSQGARKGKDIASVTRTTSGSSAANPSISQRASGGTMPPATAVLPEATSAGQGPLPRRSVAVEQEALANSIVDGAVAAGDVGSPKTGARQKTKKSGGLCGCFG